jgi:hypothetical protein
MPPPATAQTDTTAQTYDSTQAQADTTDTYATTSGMGENVATPASLEQHARDAGMDSLPMSPQEVCMPREISLTTSGVSLNRDREHQLINAADRASVCEFQRVVINSPSGRADEARQLLINSGVDAGMIEVVDADTAGLEVEMNFAGIATSSEQYAQMFSTQQLAGYQPSTAAPSYQPGTTYAPSTTAPDTTTPAPDTSFQTNPAPADTVPGRMDDLAQPSVPNPDPADNVVDGPHQWRAPPATGTVRHLISPRSPSRQEQGAAAGVEQSARGVGQRPSPLLRVKSVGGAAGPLKGSAFTPGPSSLH